MDGDGTRAVVLGGIKFEAGMPAAEEIGLGTTSPRLALLGPTAGAHWESATGFLKPGEHLRTGCSQLRRS
jgi:hypothetical protein